MNPCIAIIQARMGSERLPGKSLKLIGGKTVLEHVIDSCLQMFSNDKIFVATSVNMENDPIENLCNALKVNIIRGDETNVASRYLTIIESNPSCNYFFRICGDTPLYDYRIMQEGIQKISPKISDYDIITSLPNKGYPQGQNLELINTQLFKSHYHDFYLRGHFEHVTSYFYENIKLFKHRLVYFPMPEFYYEKYKFSIDTEEDFKRIEAIFLKLKKSHHQYNLQEKCAVYDEIKKKDNLTNCFS